MARADGERTVAGLPIEVFDKRLSLYPLGRITFYFASQGRDINGLAEPTQQMNMVLDATNDQRWGLLVLTYPRHVRMKAITNGRILQEWFTMLGRPNEMNVYLC